MSSQTKKSKAPLSLAQHYSKHHKHVNRLAPWLILLCCAAGVAMLSANRYLLSVHVLDSPILPHLEEPLVHQGVHLQDERLLRMVVEECSKGEDSVIWIDKERQMVVQEEERLDPKQCPLIDIMLRGAERDIASCTDAALYIMHGGGRLIPMVSKERYDSYCGTSTARLFLETMYPSFISSRPDVLHLMLVDHEHFWQQDSKLHKHMNVFICKTYVCYQLMHKHVVRMGYRAHVWLMGHSSSDPTVDVPQGTQRKELSFLHLKGRSRLKQTDLLLECWRQRPDFPQLTVVGSFDWDDVKDVVNAPNIRFLPEPTQASAEDQPQQTLPFSRIRQLQIENPVHICTSEREGFGHYINEARATGALIITTNHPPMNELVNPETGLLITPQRLVSYEEMALGRYAPINAMVNHYQVCEAVEAILSMPAEDLYARGQEARYQYLHEKAIFMARMQDLKSFLKQQADGLQLMDHRAGLWQHGGVLQQRRGSRTNQFIVDELAEAAQ